MNTSHLGQTAYWPVKLLIHTLILLITACGPLTPASNGTTQTAPAADAASQAYPNPAAQPIQPNAQQLYEWQGTSLRLDATLSDSHEEANVYVVQPYQPATAESAQKLAERFGIQNKAYLSSHLQLRKDAATYLVTSGGPRLYVNADYDFAFYAQYGRENNGKDISDEQARTVIDDFMASHGFEFEYQLERSAQNEADFHAVQLLDGRPLLYNCFQPGGLSFELNDDGQIFSASGSLHPTESAGKYPIRSAEEAFQFMLTYTQAGSIQNTKTEGQRGYQVWYREYPDDQPLSLHGYVEVLGPSLLNLDGYALSGNITGLDEVGMGQTVMVNGKFHTADGMRQFVVENWKISGAGLVHTVGQLHLEGSQLIFHDAMQGVDFPFRDLPHDMPEPQKMADHTYEMTGILLSDGTLAWKTIQNYSNSQSPGSITPFAGASLFKLNLSGVPLSLPTPYPTPMPVSTTAAGKLLYTVQPGDTYASIAKKFNVSLEALLKANGISDLSMLPVGQSLAIPDVSDIQSFQALRGIVTVNLFPQTNGKQRVEYRFQPDDPRYAHSLMVLEGEGLEDLQNYHNRPVDIWGRLDHVDSNGSWIVQVENHQIPYPNLEFQLLGGRQRIVRESSLESIYLFDGDDGVTYFLLNLDGTPVKSGDFDAKVTVEALAIPNETYYGFPALRVFQVLHADPSEFKITADQPLNWPTEREPVFRPDVTIEKVDLVYLLPDSLITGLTTSQGPIYAQPMWRFSGHVRSGARIEILVQALQDEFLSPELQGIELR
jgi:LysM repeat protein